MAVDIKYIRIKDDPDSFSDEDNAAKQLVNIFTEGFKNKYPNAKGKIYIFSSVSIFLQERHDIDLLVIGHFDKFEVKRNVVTKENMIVKNLNIDSFICNFEIKSHRKIEYQATHYIVKYPNGEEDATTQADEAMHSLHNYIEDRFGTRCYTCGLVWFTGIGKDALQKVNKNAIDNALHSNFTIDDFIDALPREYDVYSDARGAYHINGFHNVKNIITAIIDDLKERRVAKGLTKRKFDLITQANINVEDFGLKVGQKFTTMTGRAGTGKTIRLLQLAFHLADKDHKNRCLLLTYNNALVSDIHRLIDYMLLPTTLNQRTIAIRTVDSFFLSFIKSINGVSITPEDPKYREKYNRQLEKLYDSIQADIQNEADQKAYKDIVGKEIDWDYILIDEAQDWSETERNIIFALYGPERVVIADGVDQFAKSDKKLDWTEKLKKDTVFNNPELKKGMRQKANLINFVNAFAQSFGIKWHVEPDYGKPGGDVRIISQFNKRTYKELLQNCSENECEKYDILLLTHPNDKTEDNGEVYYSYAPKYKQMGIDFFDGINPKNRKYYPTKDMMRVYQYDSCRGLEGWAVVCKEFDRLIDYKMETFKTDEEDNLGTPVLGIDPETIKRRSVYLWSLIPLTRPIDTLVITLANPNSEVGKVLKRLSVSMKFIHWEITD